MAMPTIVTADPNLPLEAVNTVIAQQEEILGPLVTISNDGTVNLLIFDVDREPPRKHAIVDIGNPPPNITPVATGKIFVAGRLTDVMAFRPI
jgi:hypothetical protein